MEPVTVPTKQASERLPPQPIVTPTNGSAGAEGKPGSSERPPNGRSGKSSGSRRHRRISSEDLGRNFDAAGGGMPYPYPPTQAFYQQQQQPDGSGAYTNGAGSNANGMGEGAPPRPVQMPMPMPMPMQMPMQMPPDYPGGQHSRQRSWSGNFSPYAPGLGSYPPSPTPSGLGYNTIQGSFQQPGVPFVPGMTDQMQPFPGASHAAGYDNSARKNKRKNGSHRRVHSYSGGPSYGSLDMAPPAPMGPPPPLPTGRGRADFSPRNEFMKLASSYRSQSQPQSQPYPPSPKTSSMRNLQSDMRVSFSPNTPINGVDSTIMSGAGVFGMDAAGAIPHPFTAPTPTNGVSSSSPMGGEAVFLANKQNKMPSSKKKHMRQRSAQLFMEAVKGVEQNPTCRDVFFLLIFLFQILLIVYLGNVYGPEGLLFRDNALNDAVTIYFFNILLVALLSGIFAIVIAGITLLLMMVAVRKVIQLALVVTITLSFAWGTIGIGLSPKKVVPATGIIALALSVAYTFIVWDRIPFAAANLNAALVGIRSNPRTLLVALFFQLVALIWTIYFTYVFVGVYDAIQSGDWDLSRNRTIAVYTGLGISYYWMYNVFTNIVQVTVAGVIGSWWFVPEGETVTRVADLNKSLFRSVFYSFGSICFGSLTVGPVRLLRQISVFFRPNGDDSSLMCLHECLRCIQSCIASCIDGLAVRFSPWSLTYVGLYGYGLIEGGICATELFVKRGWTTIVSDDLIPNVLLLISLVIAALTGCFAHLIANVGSLSFSSLDDPVITSFVTGIAVGLVVTSILFGTISSSVNAVIVCFAASPVDFELCHPQLSNDMRSSWREVWPGCMDVLDMRVAVASYVDPSMGMGLPGPPPPMNGEQTPLLP